MAGVTVAAAASFGLAACGGVAERGPESGGNDGTPATTPEGAPATQPAQPGTIPSRDDGPKVIDPSCANPTTARVVSGGTIPRPVGSALRLILVYQGSSIGVVDIRGVDKTLPGSDGPFSDNAGYWAETRAGRTVSYQQLLRDPTRIEVFPGPPGSGQGFENKTADRCAPKTLSVDVPNDPAVTELLLFGSPYGTQDRAIELARFLIK